MILRERFKKPSISFGLGVFEKQVQLSGSTRVYLTNVFGKDYTSTIKSDKSISILKISDYEFEITPTISGTHSITVETSTKDKKINRKSNALTLIVT